MTKGAGDPSDVLRKKRVKKWLHASRNASWFVAGHTRFATRGKVNRRNAHPFRYGRIIGSHNGICDAPQKFRVDSEYLFSALNKARGDYQKGLENISGYWGLSWFDGEHFYLLSHSGELSYEVIDGVLYYSSNWSHLDSCTGGDSTVLKEGQVIRISSDGTIDDSLCTDSPVKQFTSKAYAHYGRYLGYGIGGDDEYYGCVGGGNSSHVRNYQSGGRGTVGRKGATKWQHEQGVDGYLDGATEGAQTVRDYDNEWQDAWADYCTESEHHVTTDSERYAG